MNDEAEIDHVYLRPDVKMEFLACRWLAWGHLIAPVQHAMNIAFRHLPLMQSFIANPRTHIAAASDPKLYGGPFLDLPESAVPEVAKLASDTKDRCAELIRFAHDLKDFDQILQDGAKGFCLANFYERVPSTLAGAIEIAYDLNNHPTIRMIEEITYKYRLNNKDTQEICLFHQKDSERKFFMSTPRVAIPKSYFKKIDFSDPRLDLLSSMRTHSASLKELSHQFSIESETKLTFQSFFTSEPPKRNLPNYTGEDVRVRYFGHACVLIQSSRNSILIDPIFSWDVNLQDGRYNFSDLPDTIDFLVVTHAHQDHFSPEMLVQLRHKVRKIIVPRNVAGNIADPSMSLILKRLGFTNIEIVDPFDSVQFDEGEIISLPFSGEHADLNIQSKHTLLVRIKGRKFFFLVDSDAIDPALYDLVTEIIGEVDATFVGMECFGAPLTWLYGPLLTKPISRQNDESRRLSASNCERAWRLIAGLNSPRAFIYAMGQEPWLRYLMGLEYQPDSVQLKQARNFIEKCIGVGVEVEQLSISREMRF